VLAVVLLGASCLPRHPKRTVRSEVALDPWTEKNVTSSETGQGYRYLYLAGPEAEAPDMLLLPGGFFDTRIWIYVHGLAKHFNLYALDWPDDSPLYHSRVEDMGVIAADFLQSLGISEVHVTGVSAGAYPAIELATAQEQIEVESVTLISSVMFGVSKKEVRSRRRNTKIALCLKPDKMRATAEKIAMSNEYKTAPGQVQQKDIFWVRPYSYYRQIMEMTRDQGQKKQATGKVAVPVLILHGTEDEILDYDTSKDNHTMFKDAEQIAVQGGLHSMTFSEGPLLVEMMVNFFKKRGLLGESPTG
jgi:pimeloyl-ACP methyl ester carboxylesterase